MNLRPVEFDLLSGDGSSRIFDGEKPSEVNVPTEMAKFGAERTRPRPDDLSLPDSGRQSGFSTATTPLAGHVCAIRLIVPEEEVFGPDAQRNIALVQYLQAIWNLANQKAVGEPMDESATVDFFGFRKDCEVTVTALSFVTTPKPTATFDLLDVGPESRFGWYSSASHTTSRVVSVRVVRPPQEAVRPAYFITSRAA